MEKKLEFKYVVVARDDYTRKVVAYVDRDEDVRIAILEHVESLEVTKPEDLPKFSIVKVADHLLYHQITVNIGKRLYLGEEGEMGTDEVEYEVEDTGRKFDSEDSLKEYLKDLFESGEYTSKEISEFDIIRTTSDSIRFECAEPSYEYGVDIENEHEFFRSTSPVGLLNEEEVTERIDQHLDSLVQLGMFREIKSPTVMNDEELDLEKKELYIRLEEIQKEQYKRNMGIDE